MDTIESSTAAKRVWLTPREAVASGHWPLSFASLKQHLTRRETNGLVDSGVIRQLGSRILINADELAAWIERRPSRRDKRVVHGEAG